MSIGGTRCYGSVVFPPSYCHFLRSWSRVAKERKTKPGRSEIQTAVERAFPTPTHGALSMMSRNARALLTVKRSVLEGLHSSAGERRHTCPPPPPVDSCVRSGSWGRGTNKPVSGGLEALKIRRLSRLINKVLIGDTRHIFCGCWLQISFLI